MTPSPISPPVPAGPVSTMPSQDEINARIEAIMGPMRGDILRAQQAASMQSQARLAAIGGLGGAHAGILRTIAPFASKGYYGIAEVAPQWAAGFAGESAGRVQKGMDESAAFSQSVAPAAPGAAPVDAGAMQGVLTGLGGTIPGRLYGEMGKAADKEAAGNLAGAEAATQYDIAEETLKAAGVDQQYVQQLIDLAERRPELYFQVVDEIRRVAREEDELSYNRSKADREYQLALADDRRQNRALRLQERALGLNAADDRADNAYQIANLNFRKQQHALAVEKAMASGRQIDATASKVRGYVVDKQGRFVMEGGKRIPVADTEAGKNRAKAVENRSKAVGAARSTAFNFGKKLIVDTAIRTPDLARGVGAKAYVQRRSKDGQRIFQTTDDPRKALKTITFAEAMEQAWGAIDGDTLVQQYGLSVAQVRKQIRQALIRAGWQPDGRRP